MSYGHADDFFGHLITGSAFAVNVELAMTSGGVPDEAATRRLADCAIKMLWPRLGRQRAGDSVPTV